MIIGIDEVGRGCLAGPVYAAAVCMPARYRPRHGNLPFRDSKKLTARQRETWMKWVATRPQKFSGRKLRRARPPIGYAVSYAVPRTIDRINITRAANRAAYRAYRLLLKKQPRLAKTPYAILTDGGLHLPPRVPHTSIVRGDERHSAIALASIIAKVRRDRRMVSYDKRYPAYAFKRHKGYGTRIHVAALRRHGPTPIHRRSFLLT